MSNFIYIELDTTPPSNPTVLIEGGAIYATDQLVNLTIGVEDAVTAGYQMKVFGDVDTTYDGNIQLLEAESGWVPYTKNPQVKLATGDGSKTISIRVRDDVHNASSMATASISLNTEIPTVTTTSPDVTKISKIVGKDTFSFTFTIDKPTDEYKVKLVGSTGATHDTGTLIPVTGGSTNTSGSGSFEQGTVTSVTIKGLDLESAGATTDGQKIIKVFAKDLGGLWSA